jgi:hypothetical protein
MLQQLLVESNDQARANNQCWAMHGALFVQQQLQQKLVSRRWAIGSNSN